MSTNEEPISELAGEPGRVGMGEDFIPPRQRRRYPTQLIILVLIVGVSAGALAGMRKMGMKSGVVFDTPSVDFNQSDTQKAQTYERIMDDLASVQKPLDVALGDFGNSPFMRDKSAKVTPDDQSVLPATNEAEQRKQEAVGKLKAMHLQGIIGNIARIDDETVRPGDTVSDIFTVKSIEGRKVTFEAWGQEYTLEMEINPVHGGKGPTKMRPAGSRY